MFEIKNKTETLTISFEELLRHLGHLQRTEDEIHNLNKYDDIESILSKAKERNNFAGDLANELRELESDINSKSGEIENKEHFEKIKSMLLEIDRILKQQLDELKEEKILTDREFRTHTINGDIRSNNGELADSPLTAQLKQLTTILRTQSEIVVKYSLKVQDEIKQVQANSTHEFQEIYMENFQNDFDIKLKGVDRKRILSLKELYQLRLSGNERIITNWFTACETIVYGEYSLKIVRDATKSDLLMNKYVKANYNSIDGVEVKYKGAKWNNSLSENEVLSHVFYNALFPVGSEDRDVFEKYVNWWFKTYNRTGMGVYIDQSIKDEWRLLLVDGDLNYSYLNGGDLGNYARFVLRP